MRILLAYKSHAEGADDPFTSLLPVGLLTMNSLLCKAGFDSRVGNFSRLSDDETLSSLSSSPPSVIGLSQFTHNRFETLDLARLFKTHFPGCVVILGGPHATGRWREILETSPFVDAVVVGEGEATLLELVRVIADDGWPVAAIAGLAMRGRDGRPVLEARRPALEDLDLLPIAGSSVDRSIGVDLRHQLEFLITSRGCPSSCSFCSSPRFWGRSLRFRTPQSIINEIRFLRDRFGLIYFSIRDDTFTVDRERVIDLCRGIIEERLYILWNCQSRVNALDEEMLRWMKRAGCECIQLGIESGSTGVLSRLGKRITPAQSESAARLVRNAGIRLSVYLIVGTPWEEDADIEATCRLVDRMLPSDGQVSPLVYYPGTALYDQAVKRGEVLSDLFERQRGASFPVRSDGKVSVATTRLMRALETAAGRALFTSADFRQQKGMLGYCHVTNLMAGEYYAASGEPGAAEREYLEIVGREPENPWGWLSLGELYGEEGRIDDAIEAFSMLSGLVPAHEPAYRALGELFSIAGDARSAKKYLKRAKDLLHQQ